SFAHPATPQIYTLSLHDALPICGFRRNSTALLGQDRAADDQNQNQRHQPQAAASGGAAMFGTSIVRTGGRVRPGEKTSLIVLHRSEEHTSELQSRGHLVCRLLLE